MHIHVLFPTQTEASDFKDSRVTHSICGVGLVNCALSSSRIIREQQPDLLILAGIAGVYPERPYTIRQSVLVQSEAEADLGFQTRQGFVHLSELDLAMDFERQANYVCPHLDPQLPFAQARSASVACAMTPLIPTALYDIENMEGAAFFKVCLAEQQRFLQLRTISNWVRLENDEWDMSASVQQLALDLRALLDHLTQ